MYGLENSLKHEYIRFVKGYVSVIWMKKGLIEIMEKSCKLHGDWFDVKVLGST